MVVAVVLDFPEYSPFPHLGTQHAEGTGSTATMEP